MNTSIVLIDWLGFVVREGRIVARFSCGDVILTMGRPLWVDEPCKPASRGSAEREEGST